MSLDLSSWVFLGVMVATLIGHFFLARAELKRLEEHRKVIERAMNRMDFERHAADEARRNGGGKGRPQA